MRALGLVLAAVGAFARLERVASDARQGYAVCPPRARCPACAEGWRRRLASAAVDYYWHAERADYPWPAEHHSVGPQVHA